MSAIPYEEDGEEQWDAEDQETMVAPTPPAPAVLQPPQRRAARPDHLRRRLLRRDPRRERTAVELLQHGTRIHAARDRGFERALIDRRDLHGCRRIFSSRPSGFPGGAAGFPGGAPGGNASIGTISSVNGGTIYLSDASGNTVKVTLSSATKITKSLSVSKRSLHPGDSIVVRGLKNNKGTVSATSISDSGTSNTSTTSGSASSSAGTAGGSSAVNSLFGSGGGG